MSNKSKRRKWFATRTAAEAIEPLIRSEVAGADLLLKVSSVTGPHNTFPHWRFVMEDGFAVLHYWPTKGSYRTADGAKGMVADPVEAMGLALRLVGIGEEQPQ